MHAEPFYTGIRVRDSSLTDHGNNLVSFIHSFELYIYNVKR